MKFKSNIELQSGLKDSAGAVGTSGQVLSSTVSGVSWITPSPGGVTSFNTRTGTVTLTSGDVTTALGYTPVTQARTITINGVTQDLSANRSYTVTAVETDTLQSVTNRGASTTIAITAPSYVFTGGSSGTPGLVSSTSSFRTLSPDTTTYGYGISTNVSGGLDIMANQASQPIRFWAGTTNISPIQRMIISGGDVIASDSFRAPIFYDSNNTGYYGDFASTSRINTINIDTLRGPQGDWLLGYSSGTTYSFGSTSVSDTLNIDFNSTNFANGSNWFGGYGPGSGPGLAFENQTSFARIVFWGLDFYDWNNGTQMVINDGYVLANNSMRSPIFYDSNDTGYYLDPSAGGSTPSLKVNGNIDLFARSSGWAEGIRIRVPSTNTWGGIRFTRDRGNNDGNWAIGFTGIDASDDLTFWKNNAGNESMAMRLNKDSVLTVNGDVRAPIFYDSNNTAYYVDPNSGTNLYGRFQQSGAHGDSQIGVRLLAGNNGAATGEVNLRMWCSEPNVSWDWAGFGYNVTNDGGSPNGFGRPNTSFGQAYMRMSTGGDWFFYNTNTGGTRYQSMHLTSAGNANFGGAIVANGDVTAFSDIRVKENVKTIDNALDKVLSLRGVTYNRIDVEDKTEKIGVIAQEIQEILPQVVREQEDGMLSVSYGNITAVLIEAIKEQSSIIDKLINRIEKLESK